MGKFVNGLLEGQGGATSSQVQQRLQSAPMNAQEILQGQAPANPALMPAPPGGGAPGAPSGAGAPGGAPGGPPPPPGPEGQGAPPPPMAQAPPSGPPPKRTLSRNPNGAPEDGAASGALYPPSEMEEKQARVMVAAAVDHIWGDGFTPVAMALKSPDKSLEENVGQLAADIVYDQRKMASAAEQKIPVNIMPAVGAEVVNQLYELSSSLGIWSPADEEREGYDQSVAFNIGMMEFVQRAQEEGDDAMVAGMNDVIKASRKGDYDSPVGQTLPNTMTGVSPMTAQQAATMPPEPPEEGQGAGGPPPMPQGMVEPQAGGPPGA